ncbi:MAG: efflux RND transporter permease subunit, partial [Opitutales bacterium]|nr:efflux RND transporter permease subunit [Opitutales bacterium]
MAGVLASTLTTILVFLPVGFVEQEAGQLYSDIAIAISASILASMLVAITVVPTAAARLQISTTARQTDKKLTPRGMGLAWQQFTVKTVAWLLANDRRRAACILLTFIISGAIMVTLTPPAEYLPEGEEPKVFAMMNAPPGYNVDAMVEVANELREYFMPFVDDDPERFARGETAVPALAYINLRVQASGLRIITEPKDPSDTDQILDVFTQKYREFPGMRAFAARG